MQLQFHLESADGITVGTAAAVLLALVGEEQADGNRSLDSPGLLGLLAHANAA